MAIRKLVLAFCFTRLFLAVVLWAAGSADSLAENVTLRVMCVALNGYRNNRQSEQNGGLSAAVETAVPEGSDASEYPVA
jgi:hypothetical protein